ncbi:DUF6415 family natural product biosynthesis protein [Streptomyces sp. NPDC047070]|uniref:DUF6415 family natural product biosynthesis protein n=1 Tax=Streptomyces sp. NPDC047070 TaxID=3154923 RepID=UPI0034544AE3
MDEAALDFEAFRETYEEALALAVRLPGSVPSRPRVAELNRELRQCAGVLVPCVEAEVAETVEDTANRETARWLLVRIALLLENQLPHESREAAEQTEDLALTCRALTAICDLLREDRASVPA